MACAHDHVPGCRCKDCLLLAAATNDGVSASLPAHEPPAGAVEQGVLL